MPKKSKKILIPKQDNEPVVQLVPDVNQALSDALMIIHGEIHKIRNEQKKGDDVNYLKLDKYMKNMILLAKEQRESAKSATFDLSTMTVLELEGMMSLMRIEMERRQTDNTDIEVDYEQED